MSANSIHMRAAAWRAGLFGVVLAVALAGCARDSRLACDSDTVENGVFALARDQYPNPLSKELMQRGIVNAMDHIMKEKGYDPKVKSQWTDAANDAIKAFEGAYKAGRFTLENVQTVETDAKAQRLSCRARMVVLTSWGIGVRDIAYDATLEKDAIKVKLDPIK